MKFILSQNSPCDDLALWKHSMNKCVLTWLTLWVPSTYHFHIHLIVSVIHSQQNSLFQVTEMLLLQFSKFNTNQEMEGETESRKKAACEVATPDTDNAKNVVVWGEKKI